MPKTCELCRTEFEEFKRFAESKKGWPVVCGWNGNGEVWLRPPPRIPLRCNFSALEKILTCLRQTQAYKDHPAFMVSDEGVWKKAYDKAHLLQFRFLDC